MLDASYWDVCMKLKAVLIIPYYTFPLFSIPVQRILIYQLCDPNSNILFCQSIYVSFVLQTLKKLKYVKQKYTEAATNDKTLKVLVIV